MGDYQWTESPCRSGIWIYGYPGWGAYLYSRFGTYAVSGGVYQTFANQGYECWYPAPRPWLGAPVKPYGWISEMNWGRGCYGQWFENGAVGFHDGRWNLMYGDYGQTAGRLAAGAEPVIPDDAEVPPDPPTAPPDAEWKRTRPHAPKAKAAEHPTP